MMYNYMCEIIYPRPHSSRLNIQGGAWEDVLMYLLL